MGQLEKRFPIYSQFLKLYPPAYQKKYTSQMLQTLADMLDDGQRSRADVWLRTALDLPFSLAYQNLTFSEGIMKNEMPRYVKFNALVGAVLLLPFFAALIANGLNKVIFRQDLYHSWLWSMPVLFIWVVALPTAAALLTLVSLLVSLRGRQKEQKSQKFLTGFLDLRRDWPLVIVALVGLAIMGMVRFHDSVHCLTGNPIREIHNPTQTWQCIQQKNIRKS